VAEVLSLNVDSSRNTVSSHVSSRWFFAKLALAGKYIGSSWNLDLTGFHTYPCSCRKFRTVLGVQLRLAWATICTLFNRGSSSRSSSISILFSSVNMWCLPLLALLGSSMSIPLSRSLAFLLIVLMLPLSWALCVSRWIDTGFLIPQLYKALMIVFVSRGSFFFSIRIDKN